MRVNVSVIIVDEDKVLIMKRPDHDKHYPGCWGIPGGGMDDGDESVAYTGEREVMEELGLDIHADKILDSNKYKDIVFIVMDGWLDENASRTPTMQSTEVADCKWASLSEVRKLDFTPYTKERIIKYMTANND